MCIKKKKKEKKHEKSIKMLLKGWATVGGGRDRDVDDSQSTSDMVRHDDMFLLVACFFVWSAQCVNWIKRITFVLSSNSGNI